MTCSYKTIHFTMILYKCMIFHEVRSKIRTTIVLLIIINHVIRTMTSSIRIVELNQEKDAFTSFVWFFLLYIIDDIPVTKA